MIVRIPYPVQCFPQLSLIILVVYLFGLNLPDLVVKNDRILTLPSNNAKNDAICCTLVFLGPRPKKRLDGFRLKLLTFSRKTAWRSCLCLSGMMNPLRKVSTEPCLKRSCQAFSSSLDESASLFSSEQRGH